MVKTVIRFGASWCGPCRVYSPIFHKVSEMDEFNGIEFKTVDVDEEDGEELVEKYKVMGVPTTVVLDENDGVLEKQHGLMTESTLIDLLNKLIESERMK
jgi:thioredoxin 1